MILIYFMQDLIFILKKCDNMFRLAEDRNDERILLSYDEVVRSIKHIKCGKACGQAQVSARVLRSCKNFEYYKQVFIKKSINEEAKILRID